MPHSRRTVLAQTIRLAALGLAPVPLLRAAEAAFTADPFRLGVASGYPEPHGVVLWTRLAPEPDAPGGGMSGDAVAVDWEIAEDEGFRRVRRRGRAFATPAWAHAVHVDVRGLEPAREYWYRFTSGGAQSPVGRTKTAPASRAAVDRLAVAVACCQHYESGHYAAYRAMANDDLDLVVHVGDYIYETRGVARVRAHDAGEAQTLDDYRRRYALYKSDPALQAAHAAFPWMATSDDHEVDNDYAGSVPEDDTPAEPFLVRRAAAYRAYYEHLPLPRRMAPAGSAQRLYARRAFGDLVELFTLDGRQFRDPQACGGGTVAPCADLLAERRSMLGRRQERWLERRLRARRARWSLLAQQTVFAHMDQTPGDEIGYWSDGWSGYPAARRRLTRLLAERDGTNTLILSGDIHAFLVNDVHADPGRLESAIVATELVTTSISSAGPPQAVLDGWVAENPNVRLAESRHRGYTRLTVGRERLEAELVAVDDVARADSGVHVLAAFAVESGRPGVAR